MEDCHLQCDLCACVCVCVSMAYFKIRKKKLIVKIFHKILGFLEEKKKQNEA